MVTWTRLLSKLLGKRVQVAGNKEYDDQPGAHETIETPKGQGDEDEKEHLIAEKGNAREEALHAGQELAQAKNKVYTPIEYAFHHSLLSLVPLHGTRSYPERKQRLQ
jgi:hypothetical protein